MTLEDGQPSQGHADDAGAPLQPSARVVEVNAGGMPLFRTDPG
jgi:hypothetical protein